MNRWLWIWKSYLFFRLYFHYCLSSVHYCEDRSHIHFFIRISHIRFSYIHRQDYNYYKGKMAHNNTQQMESYYNTSINHSINVKQSNDVHFVCDSNNRNKLKIINTGLYMMTIFNEYKSSQNSHIQQNINKPFNQLHLQYRPFYRHTLTTIKWHHKKEKNEELVTLISKKFQSYYAPLRLPWPKTRNIRGNLRWKEFSHFYTSTHDMVHYQVERTLSLSCRDYNYSYIILYPPGMSPLEINSSESCGPVQHMHHVFPRTYFSATICFRKRYSVIPQLQLIKRSRS